MISLQHFTFVSDIVFFIFLYQRWIYKTDPTRVNEFGFSREMEQEAAASQSRQQANGAVPAITASESGQQANGAVPARERTHRKQD
jgi:hypothetical protein